MDVSAPHRRPAAAPAAAERPTAGGKPRSARPRARRNAFAAAAASPSSPGLTEQAEDPQFARLYSQLSGILAPGGAVAAAPTPLGRGLVATHDVAQGATLLSGEGLGGVWGSMR